MSKTVRVDEDLHETLAEMKGEEESFSDVIRRLLAQRREQVRDGAGFWADSDAAARAREARDEMKDGMS